jgi:hypothetical protein
MAKAGETIATVDRALSIVDRLGRWGVLAVSLVPGGAAYRQKTGPKEQRLKLKGDWQALVAQQAE